MDWKTLFLSANGRIGRQSFWIGVLILIGVNVVLGWIPLIGQLIWLASIWCGVCLYSKRLHDMGRSGWLQLIPIGVSVVLMAVGMAFGGVSMMSGWAGGMHHPGAMMSGVGWAGMGLVMLLSCLVGLGFLLWVGLTPSQPGANAYGEPPAPSPLPSA